MTRTADAPGGTPRIVLVALEGDFDGVAVGTCGGRPLVYVGRTATVDGREIDHETIALPLLEAVNEAATRVFGHEWVTSLCRVFEINKRSTARDRIFKSGLPTFVLRSLAEMASDPTPRALGHAIMAGVDLRERSGSADRLPDLAAAAGEALSSIREQREIFRRQRDVPEEQPSWPAP